LGRRAVDLYAHRLIALYAEIYGSLEELFKQSLTPRTIELYTALSFGT